MIFVTNMIQRTWSPRQDIKQESTRQGAQLPPQARPPPSWGPCCSTDVLLPPIYTYVPPDQQKHPQNPNSTAATFCTREIPSWGLFRCSGGAPEKAPKWDLTDRESYGGGLRVLAPYLVVWGYVGIYRRKKYVGGATWAP